MSPPTNQETKNVIDPALLRERVPLNRLGEFAPPSSGPPSRSEAEMADTVAENTPLTLAVDTPNSATDDGGHVEKDEAGSAEPETEKRNGGVEMKMEAAEAGDEEEEQPAASADREAKSEEKAAAAAAAATSAMGESRDESGEPTDDSQLKAAKEEQGEDSLCSELECEKSKAVCEESDKPGGSSSSSSGAELDKRRPSVEISSSDGEPLSRMDSEDRWVWWRDFAWLPYSKLNMWLQNNQLKINAYLFFW